MTDPKRSSDKTKPQSEKTEKPIPGATSEVQGEGDYKSARRYNERTTEFARRSDVEGAAREAAPDSTAEASELEDAERAGRARAKEEDPLLDRPEDIREDDSASESRPTSSSR